MPFGYPVLDLAVLMTISQPVAAERGLLQDGRLDVFQLHVNERPKSLTLHTRGVSDVEDFQ